MDRRALIAAGLTTLGTAACAAPRGPAQPMNGVGAPNMAPQPGYSTGNAGAQTYTRDEIVNTVSDFLGVTAESAGAAIESVFRDNGSPTGYIAGEELAGAIGLGLRYGSGLLYMKNQEPMRVYWQGPSIGFDTGGNASRVFTLC